MCLILQCYCIYIFKPTIDLNGGGRQGNIVDHSLCEYLRTTNCCTGVRILALPSENLCGVSAEKGKFSVSRTVDLNGGGRQLRLYTLSLIM